MVGFVSCCRPSELRARAAAVAAGTRNCARAPRLGHDPQCLQVPMGCLCKTCTSPGVHIVMVLAARHEEHAAVPFSSMMRIDVPPWDPHALQAVASDKQLSRYSRF